MTRVPHNEPRRTHASVPDVARVIPLTELRGRGKLGKSPSDDAPAERAHDSAGPTRSSRPYPTSTLSLAGICSLGHTIAGVKDVRVHADRIRCGRCVDLAAALERATKAAR